MINFILLFALLGFVFIPVGIIWLIVAFVRKTKKKIPLIIFVFGILLVGIGIGTTEYYDKNNTMEVYTTKLNKVSVSKNIVQKGDWVIKGSTKAPNGSKIIVVNLSDSSDETTKMPIASTSDVSWPKVENGKFKAYINTLEALGPYKHQVGQSVSLHIVAITNYKKKMTGFLPSKIISIIRNNSSSNKFSLTPYQSNYLNSLK